jgi:hypothetical protein
MNRNIVCTTFSFSEENIFKWMFDAESNYVFVKLFIEAQKAASQNNDWGKCINESYNDVTATFPGVRFSGRASK